MRNPRKATGFSMGLGALLGTMPVPTAQTQRAETSSQLPEGAKTSLVHIPLRDIRKSPYQPRRLFSESAIEELASSIDSHGLVQPIIVRQSGSKFELVAGERRLRAISKLSRETVPCLVVDLDDSESALVGLMENTAREDLNIIEVARGFKRLQDEFGWTLAEIASEHGKSRSSVANTIRLLNLDASVIGKVEKGLLQMGHARALVSLENHNQQLVAAQIIDRDLSVRETEKLVKTFELNQSSPTVPHEQDSHGLEKRRQDLADLLSRPVTIQEKGGKGKIKISYSNVEDLLTLASRIQ